MNVWTYHGETPKFARLDYWSGIPFMIFGNILAAVGLPLYISLFVVGIGAIFLNLTQSPIFLLETVEEGDACDARLVDVRDFVFHFGISKHQVLSGPYSDTELHHLKQDLEAE